MVYDYLPTNWQNGDLITAERMNNIESGVVDLHEMYFIEDRFIDGTLSEYTNNIITSIPDSAFYRYSNLQSVSFPNAIEIGTCAFYSCSNLVTISFPNVISIYNSAFTCCSKLSNLDFPSVTSIYRYAFYYCLNLQTAKFSMVNNISSSAFYGCSRLESLYLLGSTVANLSNTTVFYYTPINNSSYLGHFGSIYVPASLVNSYKTKTNWSYYSSRITAYTE